MKKLKIIAIILLITVNQLAGQNGNTIINKSYKLDSIIKLKKELNSKIQNLRIQIYNGDRTNAELIIKEYIDNFNDTTADIIYETPNYKIWVGNYYTQLEADRNLIKIRKKFSSAFIFRPELIEEMDENQDID
ncbi:MAG: translation initiation factor IF-2 [Flavobacteriaceae bacterium]|nr:translation initiation factor IF-2 [Flavobacteriaceae bacterium]|tara:strand:+ start:59 stop:457 length:399 start_codon:yes stop_codon:yes gene_type:complete